MIDTSPHDRRARYAATLFCEQVCQCEDGSCPIPVAEFQHEGCPLWQFINYRPGGREPWDPPEPAWLPRFRYSASRHEALRRADREWRGGSLA